MERGVHRREDYLPAAAAAAAAAVLDVVGLSLLLVATVSELR